MDCTQSTLAQQALPRSLHTAADHWSIGAEGSPMQSRRLAHMLPARAAGMPLVRGRALQQLFDAYPGFLHLLVRSRQRYWRALAKILRGERGFADVERVLHRHPYLVRDALW